MATHSSVLAWRIPGTEESGGLLSMESHRVGHDWSDLVCMHRTFLECSHTDEETNWGLECKWSYSLWTAKFSFKPKVWPPGLCPFFHKCLIKLKYSCSIGEVNGIPVFLPVESCGQRILVDCCPWGCRVGHDWSNLASIYDSGIKSFPQLLTAIKVQVGGATQLTVKFQNLLFSNITTFRLGKSPKAGMMLAISEIWWASLSLFCHQYDYKHQMCIKSEWFCLDP